MKFRFRSPLAACLWAVCLAGGGPLKRLRAAAPEGEPLLPEPLCETVRQMEILSSPIEWLDERVAVDLETGDLIWISPDVADPLSSPGLVVGRFYRSRLGSDEGAGWDWRVQLLRPADPANERGHIVREGRRPVAVQSEGRRLAELLWEQDRLVEIRRVGAGARRLRYTSDGALEEETGDGPQARYRYDAAGRLAAVEWNGRPYRFRYDVEGRIAVVSLPGGQTVHFEYETKAGVRHVRAQSVAGVRLAWSFEPRRTILRRDRREARAEFDAAGRPVRFVDFDGGETICERDAAGRPIRIRDTAGAEWTVRRDAAGRPIEWTLPGGGRERVRYDADSRTIEYVDVLGRPFVFAAEEGGGVRLHGGGGDARAALGADGAVSIEGVGEGWRFERGALFERIRDPLGRAFECRFNAAGQMTEMIETGGARHRFEYDRPGGLLVAYTGPDNVVTRFETHPASFEWSAMRRVDGDIEFEYDEWGRRIRERDGLSRRETTYLYDREGRLAGTDLSDGGRQRFGWDASGRPRSVESFAEGRTIIQRFDTSGRLVEEEVRGGDRTRYRYDAAGRPVEEDSTAFGRILYETDAAGRLRSATSPHMKTSWTFDAADRLIRSATADAFLAIAYHDGGYEMRDATGQWRRFETDAMGRVLGMEDAAGARRRYTLDGADRVIRIEGPGDRVETLAYSPDGRLLTWEVGGTTVLAFEYDETSRPVSARGPHGGMRWRHETDGSALIEQDGTTGREIARHFDAAGRTIALQTAGAPPIRLAYDNAGRLLEVAAGRHSVQLAYDEFGRRVEQRYSIGLRLRFVHDGAGRMAALEAVDRAGRAVYRAAWTYDEEGRVVATDFHGRTGRLAYTAAGAVASFTPARGRAETYAYDAGGGLTRIGDRRMNAGPMHRLTQAGDRGYTWDALGSAATAGDWRFAYDDAGQLAAAGRAGRVIRFRYDARGRLAARETAADTVQFQYDDERLLAIWSGNRPTLYLPGGMGYAPAAILDDERMLCPIFDPNGSLLAVVNEAGDIVWEAVYRPFGEREVVHGEYVPALDFHGRYRDPDLGLLCFGARWYDPFAGRFLQPDPDPGDGGDPFSLNAYLLARNDPVNFTDPSGLKPNRFLSQQRIEQIKAANAQTVNQTAGRVMNVKNRLDNGLRNLNPPAGGNTQSDFLQGLRRQGPQGGWRGAGPKGSTADALAQHYGGGAPPARGFDTRQAAEASRKIQSQLAARGPQPAPLAPAAPRAPTPGARLTQWGGRALVVYGVVTSANNIYQAPDKVGAAANEAARWGGAYAGAKLGGMLGAPFGPIGAGLGGLAGGIAGSMLGEVLCAPENRPAPPPPGTPTDPAAIEKGLAGVRRSGMPLDPGTPGIAGGTADIGGASGLKSAEPGAAGGGIPSAGGSGAPGVLDSFSSQREDSRSAVVGDATGLMTANRQMTAAAGAGDQQRREAKRTREAGGKESQDIREVSARTTAEKQRDESWGREIGEAVTEGVQKGGEAFGEAMGTAAAQKAAGAIFGPSPRNDSSSSASTRSDGEQGRASPSGAGSSSAAASAGTETPSAPRPPKSEDKDEEQKNAADGGPAAEPTAPTDGSTGGGIPADPIGVKSTTRNPDGTVTVTYGCGYSWTGQPPAPPQCPICGRETVSTQAVSAPSTPSTPASGKKKVVVRCPICKSTNVQGPNATRFGPAYKCAGCGACVKSYAMIREEVDE